MGREERSAGFVVYYRPPGATDMTAFEFLLLDYGRHWDFPKGHVERGEDDLSTARRELREETGIGELIVLPGFRQEITYFFRHKRHGLVRKMVVFFLGEIATKQVTISHEHEGFEFLSYNAALARVTFPTAKQILRTAWDTLNPSTGQLKT